MGRGVRLISEPFDNYLKKKVVKVICNVSYLGHSMPLFCNSKIQKLVDIYTYNLSIYMFDHHQNPEFYRNHLYSTRNRINLIPPLNVYPRLSALFPITAVKCGMTYHLILEQ